MERSFILLRIIFAIGRFFKRIGLAIWSFIFSFIGSDATREVQPIYFWATLFLTLIAIAIYMRMTNDDAAKRIDNGFLAIMVGIVIALIGIYNWDKATDKKITTVVRTDTNLTKKTEEVIEKVDDVAGAIKDKLVNKGDKPKELPL
jgi:hypothetical protein